MSLFTSPEERRLREKEYQKKIFPLGMEQRELALAALRPHINGKIGDTELIYAFVVAKQKYLDADGDFTAAQKYIKKAGGFTGHEKAMILELVMLDAKVQSLDSYPSAEALAGNLENRN